MPRRLLTKTALALLVLGVCSARTPATAESGDEPLGRLFFTPERRQQLDRQRDLNLLDRQQTPADPTLAVDGIVTRSSGKRTAWINGAPVHEDDAWSGLTVTRGNRVPGEVLIESTDAPAIRARVGETVNRSTGEAQDPLHGGQIRIHRRALAR